MNQINILTTTLSFSSFKVAGKIPGFHRDAKVEIPIIIGSIPFAEDQSKHGHPAAPNNGGGYNFPVTSGSGFNAPSAPAGYPQPNDPLLPPNYNAATASLYPNIQNSTLPPFPVEEK